MLYEVITAFLFFLFGYAAAALAAVVFRMTPKKRHALVNSSILYNTGNIGIPLITLIYTGTPYLNQALVAQITLMLLQVVIGNTVGIYNAGRGQMHWKDSIISVLKMPAIYVITSYSIHYTKLYDDTQH